MATVRQKRALEKIVENGGNVSRAMIDVGYSPQTAKTPQKLTESKAFIELLEEAGIDDMTMLKTLKEGLVATKTVSIGEGTTVEPDHQNRHKFLETALRIKGYNRDNPTGNTINFNF